MAGHPQLPARLGDHRCPLVQQLGELHHPRLHAHLHEGSAQVRRQAGKRLMVLFLLLNPELSLSVRDLIKFDARGEFNLT